MLFLATQCENARDYGERTRKKSKKAKKQKKKKVVVTGIEPMTFGLLDQRSTN
jgi:hypothetical protein